MNAFIYFAVQTLLYVIVSRFIAHQQSAFWAYGASNLVAHVLASRLGTHDWRSTVQRLKEKLDIAIEWAKVVGSEKDNDRPASLLLLCCAGWCLFLEAVGISVLMWREIIEFCPHQDDTTVVTLAFAGIVAIVTSAWVSNLGFRKLENS